MLARKTTTRSHSTIPYSAKKVATQKRPETGLPPNTTPTFDFSSVRLSEAAPRASETAANPKIFFDIGERKGQRPWIDGGWVKISPALKGKGSLEFADPDICDPAKAGTAPITVGPAGSAGQGLRGVKAELELAHHTLNDYLLGIAFGKDKEKLSFELTQEKLDVSVGVEVRAWHPSLQWLQAAGDAKFIFAGAKWDEVRNDPEKVKILAGELALGFNVEGNFTLSSGKVVKASVTGQIVVSATPNWARIGAETAKVATRNAGETALVIDTGAFVSAAAAIVLPAAFVGSAVYGAMQTEKNLDASRAAIDVGLKLRTGAQAYMRDYLAALSGRSSAGPGAEAAMSKVLVHMAATNKDKETACRDLLSANAGLSITIEKELKDRLFADAIARFDRDHTKRIGLLERLGEDWGMRGVFRRYLRTVLYASQ